MPETDLDLLIEAAKDSAVIAQGFFQSDPKVWDKEGNAGPVTEADLAIDAMLIEKLRTARPSYGWLSEETEDGTTRLSTERQFVVDPIDGTRAFIKGDPDWSHALAVIEDNTVIAAAVYVPERDLMYAAARGQGATLNGTNISVTEHHDLEGADVLTAKPNLDPKYWNCEPPNLNRHMRSSLAYRLCLVAEGQFDAMLSLRPSWEWDIAAGALIIQEAGGTATDMTGGPLRFNNPHPQVNGVVAGGDIHSNLLGCLNRA
ncbi:MAG: 3'(2'),5'-bisphosphate nucleotidase CysQ [Paracoccaceae bacterium]|nr:3'(2'),5'-bisphosphate nucleotidase CysQ [Paracoccaceae bacterium]